MLTNFIANISNNSRLGLRGQTLGKYWHKVWEFARQSWSLEKVPQALPGLWPGPSSRCGCCWDLLPRTWRREELSSAHLQGWLWYHLTCNIWHVHQSLIEEHSLKAGTNEGSHQCLTDTSIFSWVKKIFAVFFKCSIRQPFSVNV